MCSRYVRDYYVNVGEGVEVSGVEFEGQVLRGGVAQVALRANGASPNFKMNPLYEEVPEEKKKLPKSLHRSSHCESGYASSLDSLASESVRLAPPPTPEVVERMFLSLPRLRKEGKSRKKTRLSGSFRMDRSAQSSLWG